MQQCKLKNKTLIGLSNFLFKYLMNDEFINKYVNKQIT
jgi:hypothetical protein